MNTPNYVHRPVIAAASLAAFILAGSIHAAQDKTPARKSSASAALALSQFTAQQPGIIVAKTADGRVNKIAGHAFANGSSPADAAGDFIELHAGMFGIDAVELEAGKPFAGGLEEQPLMYDRATDTYKFTNMFFHQSVDGIPVFGSRLSLLVKNTAGHPVVQATSDLKPLGEFRPGINRGATPDLGKAVATGTRFLGQPARLASDPAYMIFAGGEDEAISPRLAARVEVESGSKINDTYSRWLLLVDSETGDVLYEEDRIVNCGHTAATTAANAISSSILGDVSGTVTSQSTDGSGADICESDSNYAMPYAYVSGNNGASTYADEYGFFSLDNSGAVVEATSGFTGQWFAVNNDQGSEATYSTLISDGGVGEVHNANTSEFTLAQSDAYLQSNIVRDFVLYYSPSYPIIGTQQGFPVNVNLSSSCNAFYDYSSINFYNEAGGCSNTAFSVIVHHEYGHHLVDCAGSGQGAYGEGMGDVMGVLITGDNQLARGFYTNDCVNGIRNADNNCQYDAAGCSTCGSAIHSCGQLISGVVWDLVDLMEAAYPADGFDIAAQLVIDSMPLHSGSSINGTILLDYLTLDDDDGDLSNGTPHIEQIQQAFELHNMGDIPEPLDNDDCVTAREITWGTWDVNTIGALSSGVPVDESQCSGTYMTECDPDVWYRLVACGTGTMTVSLCDSVNFDSDLAVYTGSCDGLTQIACNGDNSGCGGYTSLLSVDVTEGQTCFIRIGGWNGATGSGTMSVEGPGEPCESGSLSFGFPEGLPEVLHPDGSTTIRVEIGGSGEVVPQPGTGALHYVQDGTESMGTMYEVSDNVYDASFPSLECLPVDYWFSAQDSEGAVYNSSSNSASVYSEIVVTYEDDCETDTGWSVSGGATDGQWDRGIPVNCERCDPPPRMRTVPARAG